MGFWLTLGHFSTVRVTEHWHIVPKQAVASPVLGDIRKLSGHGSGQVAVDGSVEQGPGPDQLLSAFEPQSLCEKILAWVYSFYVGLSQDFSPAV